MTKINDENLGGVGENATFLDNLGFERERNEKFQWTQLTNFDKHTININIVYKAFLHNKGTFSELKS